MSELCRLCGEPVENGCNHQFKKMCINCAFVKTNAEGALVCGNETNMENALANVREAIKNVNGYSITKMEVEPIALKNPTKKCGLWALSDEVVEYLKTLFV